ncbi:DNA polymerase epsilon catalytic subunit, partial [Tanacetum coccineum]
YVRHAYMESMENTYVLIIFADESSLARIVIDKRGVLRKQQPEQKAHADLGCGRLTKVGCSRKDNNLYLEMIQQLEDQTTASSEQDVRSSFVATQLKRCNYDGSIYMKLEVCSTIPRIHMDEVHYGGVQATSDQTYDDPKLDMSNWNIVKNLPEYTRGRTCDVVVKEFQPQLPSEILLPIFMRSEPLYRDKKMTWKREMTCLLSVCVLNLSQNLKMEHPSRRICTDKIVLEECLGHTERRVFKVAASAYIRSLQKQGVFRASVSTIVIEKLDSEGCRVAVKYSTLMTGQLILPMNHLKSLYLPRLGR